jgi:O-antigen/teichoic acid export membrane protein
VSRHAATGQDIHRDHQGRVAKHAAVAAGAPDRPPPLHARPNRLSRFGRLSRLSRPGIGRSIVATAGFNLTVNVSGAVGGIIVARALGPSVRGEYSAVTSWLGVALLLGELGLPIALCFYVAHDPQQAHAYVATARAMMIATGTVGLVAGMILAPVLARGHPGLATAYRIAFSCVAISCVSDSFAFALMGRDLQLWNKVRISQPLVALVSLIVAWRLHVLTLDTALMVIIGSLLIQLGWAYWGCRRVGLVPGRYRVALIRPLAGYGIAQIAAIAPASVNAYLDQLVLSVTVPPADLGRYSIAVSMALLPAPLVSAIGYVLFPKLAAGEISSTRTSKLQRDAVLASVMLAVAVLAPLVISAPWLVPLVFGPAYRGAVPLLWILAPGGVFLSCGQVVANLLRGHKRQLVVAKAEGIAVIFTLVLLGTLLPVLGVTGAAIASTIPYGVSLALMLRSLRQLARETDEGA